MSPISNYLTIDVEDYFQVSAFEDIIDPRDTRPLLCEFAELAWRVLD